MKRKVYKVWMSRQASADIFGFDDWHEGYIKPGNHLFFKTKGQKEDWGDNEHWPPRRATITVEVED